MNDMNNVVDPIIQTCSGITRGRVLNGELYTQGLQKLIYLHLFTDCVCSHDVGEIFMKQSVNICR